MADNRGAGDTLASNIRAELARRGITQDQVGRALGISQPAVSRRINGRSSISAIELQRIAALCKVPVEVLLPQEAAA